jgi:hypothetical protein
MPENRLVRFDERGRETERCHLAAATALVLDSTRAADSECLRSRRVLGVKRNRCAQFEFFSSWTQSGYSMLLPISLLEPLRWLDGNLGSGNEATRGSLK